MTGLANALPDDVDTLKAMLLAERARADRLAQIIKELQRHRFGRRAETLPIDQLELGLEDVQQAEAVDAAEKEKADPAARSGTAKQRRANRGSLPAHLPRVEVVVDVESKLCPCCSGELHRIGEDVAERLDIIPAQLRVLVTRRPKYACRACEEGVVQAPAPARLIEGGLPTEATVAHVIVGKYADHLPLYRQAQIYGRQGVQLDRSTLADWVGRADAAMNVQWKLTLAAEHQRDKDYAEVPRGDTRPTYGDALLAAQRAWLKFRDSECEVEAYAVRGGSMEPQIAAECEARLTQERTKQLAAIAKGLD